MMKTFEKIPRACVANAPAALTDYTAEELLILDLLGDEDLQEIVADELDRRATMPRDLLELKAG